jgi:hypothetical protein
MWTFPIPELQTATSFEFQFVNSSRLVGPEGKAMLIDGVMASIIGPQSTQLKWLAPSLPGPVLGLEFL